MEFFFGKLNINFNYIGIDNDLDCIKENKKIVLTDSNNTILFHCCDARYIDEFSHLLRANSIDLVIYRHPNILYKPAIFFKILHDSITYSINSNKGILFLSTYHDEEIRTIMLNKNTKQLLRIGSFPYSINEGGYNITQERGTVIPDCYIGAGQVDLNLELLKENWKHNKTTHTYFKIYKMSITAEEKKDLEDLRRQAADQNLSKPNFR